MLWSLLFIFLQPAHANDPTVMRRESFIQQMKQEGLKTFCSDRGMSKCYKINASECKATFESGMARCLKGVEVPKEVSLLGEDEIIQEKLGECLGTEYSKDHSSKFRENSECAVRK